MVVGEQEANKGPEEVTERENSMKKKKNSTTTGQEEVEKKKGRIQRRSHAEEGVRGYSRYVFMVLRQVHLELAISSKAKAVLNAFMGNMFECLAGEAAQLSRHVNKSTLSWRGRCTPRSPRRAWYACHLRGQHGRYQLCDP